MVQLLCHFGLQNPKNFRVREPFKFSNGRFFNPYETVNKYSNVTLLPQIKDDKIFQFDMISVSFLHVFIVNN